MQQVYRYKKLFKCAPITEVTASSVVVDDAGTPATFELGEEWCLKNRPAVGGYLMEHQNGYMAFASKAGFEANYEATDDAWSTV